MNGHQPPNAHGSQTTNVFQCLEVEETNLELLSLSELRCVLENEVKKSFFENGFKPRGLF